MFWYATASLTPAFVITLACLRGGGWVWAALASVTVVVFALDKITRAMPAQSHTTGRMLSLTLAVVHFALLPLGIWALATGDFVDPIQRIGLFFALGLFVGQVSNSNAHELIHATARLPRRIGAAIYISLLHGHHVSAHLRVHHIHAATDADPNSAPLGVGFWAYALRALRGEFIAGFRADTAQRARAAVPPTVLSHPFIAYVAGGLGFLALSFMIAGWRGIAVHLAIATYAQMQLYLSDYVQHYGLRRHKLPDGKTEPIGPRHSWNTGAWYSAAMMLNAPRHSDHHLRPARAFPALEIAPDTMPMLPRSLPVMGVIALVPPIWRRVMDARVARWQERA